jgi:hypothetical protein
MAADYERALAAAAGNPTPSPRLPAHLRDDGSQRLRALATELGTTEAIADLAG